MRVKTNIKTLAMPSFLQEQRAMTTAFFATAIYLAVITAAYACIPNGTNSPMGFVLCEVVYFMYGNLGRGLATLAIAVLGVGALLGKTSWGMAITVGVGVAVIFNAHIIASLLLCGDTSAHLCF